MAAFSSGNTHDIQPKVYSQLGQRTKLKGANSLPVLEICS